MEIFFRDQLNKIGNTIILFNKVVPRLHKLNILYGIFLIEETCISQYGHYFIGAEYELWALGPVQKDIYIDLSEDNPELLKKFIRRDTTYPNGFISQAAFDDDEFSTNELEIMHSIANFIKEQSATQLSERILGQSSLWRKSATRHGVLDILESKFTNSTHYKIDFDLLFDNTPDHSFLKDKFECSKENFQFIKHLKR